MSLGIYRLDEATFEFTLLSDGDVAAPLDLSAVPGGSAMVRKLFLRNSATNRRYTGITIKPVAVNDADIVDGTISVKILSGDKRPTDTDWAGANSNANATLVSPLAGGPTNTRVPELGAAGPPATADTKYYPFWVRFEAFKSAPIDLDLIFRLEVVFTEFVV